MAQDGNGAPIPDTRWGFHPLGDENGIFFIPVGSLTREIHPPSGESGKGVFSGSLSPHPSRLPNCIVLAGTRPKEAHKNKLAQLKTTI